MKFDYYFEPSSLDECVHLMNEYGPDARLLAGGTDLVVKMRNRLVKPKAVVSLNQVKELSRIHTVDDGLKLGAMVRLMDISKSDILTGAWEVVKNGAGHVSSMQVRNIGTIGGNSCNASPSADTVPCIMVLYALVNIRGPKGDRDVLLEKFFTGPGKTVLERGEVVVGFTIPNFGKENGTAYKKYAIRGDTDIAIVGVGARLRVDSHGSVTEARLVLGAVAPVPLRVPDVESMLTGNKLDDELIAKAAVAAGEACNPISDARATAGYRREMIRVWVKHVLGEAYAKATGK
ncbi:MAG: xanthine dehydrogenase family protein subunit M [Planctomycetes bacterium]|nr:xanthine dehydrogenase family protein subunit M [Planctomycetota bacterium]